MEKTHICSVIGCNKPAIRSVSVDKMQGVDLKYTPYRRRVYLCKEHYKIYKKQRRKIERFERMRWG